MMLDHLAFPSRPRSLPAHFSCRREQPRARPLGKPEPAVGNGDAEAVDVAGFAPNAFIRIGSDGQIFLTMPYVEMGQGTYTSIPMLIAESWRSTCRRCGWSMLRPTKSSTAILCSAAFRLPATRTRYARRGSRCAKPVRS